MRDSEELEQHLDRHYQKTHFSLKEHSQKPRFLLLQEWLTDDKVVRLEEEEEALEEKFIQKYQESDGEKRCNICGDQMQISWIGPKNNWYYKNAAKMSVGEEQLLVHYGCLREYEGVQKRMQELIKN